MAYVLSSKQMKAMDKRTIKDFGLPARILMENAGNGCADYLLATYPEMKSGMVTILHGCGNNSGDGFVIARKLFLAGINVTLVQVHCSKFSEESKANYDLCTKLNILMLECLDETCLGELVHITSNSCMIIDAVFGIGFHGELSDYLKEVFEHANISNKPRIAIDIPSGINADTGAVDYNAFRATETLCIHAPKFGSILNQGRIYSGKLTTIKISIFTDYKDNASLSLVIDEENCEYPDRFEQANKGDYGRVVIIGGSPGFSGSAAMAAKAALRAGAGYCYLMSRPEMEAHYYHLTPEIMFRAIPEYPETGLPDEEKLRELLKQVDSVVIGCGMGLDAYALNLLKIVLQYCKARIVVDADAIRLIADNKDLQQYLNRRYIVLTPHLGEFSRLCGKSIKAIYMDTIGELTKYIKKTKAQILLKGYTTVFANDNYLLFNTSGNDGLATGGSGDVLAGIIGSFLAQGLYIPTAAINASYLLGKTAEKLSETRLPASILPSDIIDNLFVK